jgi:hypothetical protein
MKKQIWVLITLVVICVLSTTAAFAAETTPPPEETPQVEKIDTSAILEGLKSGAFWFTLLATFVAGAIGGIVYDLLLLEGRLERPHAFDPNAKESFADTNIAIGKYTFDLGTISRVIIGGIAAIAAMWVFSPTDTFELLSISVIAGSAGTSVFNSLKDRLIAALAIQETEATQDRATQLADKQREISTMLEDPSLNLRDTETKANLQKLINEANGIAETLK